MAATANTTIQLDVPDHLRGRVMSVYTTVFSGSVPAGGLIMGAAASAFGVPTAIAIGGALSLLIGVAAPGVGARGTPWRSCRAVRWAPPAAGRCRAPPAPAERGSRDSETRLGSAEHDLYVNVKVLV